MRWRIFLTILSLCLSLNCLAQTPRTEEWRNVETYFQYVPGVADFTLGYMGVRTDSEWYDRLIKIGVGFGTEMILTHTIKALTNERRPDGSDFHSFPSGHTATAFLGADLIRQDYGWGWGAGAYALATGVGVMRVVHKRHNWWDALAGAGIGVLSANIGRWTCEPLKKLFGIKPKENLQLSFAPTADPCSGACGAALLVRF